MVDNSNVVVAAGTGADMIPAPEMAAFAARYGFVFIAHEKGDANRSARVEAPFHRIEKGFLVGETFTDWTGLEPPGARHVRDTGTRSTPRSCMPAGGSSSPPSRRTSSPCRCTCRRSTNCAPASSMPRGT